jgi:predicted transcriptional regulator
MSTIRTSAANQNLPANSDELFQSVWKELNPSFISKFLHFSGFNIDDLRQEVWLICHEITMGTKKYDPTLSSKTGYVINTLSGRLKWLVPHSVNWCKAVMTDEDNENMASIEDATCNDFRAPSPLDLMVEREEREQAEQQEREREELLAWVRSSLKLEHQWIHILHDGGLSQTSIAEIGGVSQSFVSRFLNKRQTTKKVFSEQRNSPKTMANVQNLLFQ